MSFGISSRTGLGIGLKTVATLSSSKIGGRPALALNFLDTASLDSRITFTRSTTATFVGSDGLIQTAAINAPRFDYAPTTLASRGLLIEEQRTNLLLNSLIDGTSLSTQSVSVTAVAHTISFYGTGTITLSGATTATVTGTGVYPNRQTLTFTPTVGVLVCTVTGSVQYAQLEVGTFATSFIPTAGSTVTRTADVAVMTGTNFSSWFNQTEGTFVTKSQLSRQATLAGTTIVMVSASGSVNDQIVMFYRATGNTGFDSVVGGVSQAGLNNGVAITANTVAKIASAYKVNDFAMSTNAGTVQTDTSGTLPTVNQMQLGAVWISPLNGCIRSVDYYPTRLANEVLQALTA